MPPRASTPGLPPCHLAIHPFSWLPVHYEHHPSPHASSQARQRHEEQAVGLGWLRRRRSAPREELLPPSPSPRTTTPTPTPRPLPHSLTCSQPVGCLPHRPWGPPLEPTVKERLHLEVQAGSGRFFDIFKPVVFGRRGLRLPRCARCHVSLHARKRRPRGAPAKNTRTARNADKQKRRGGAAGLPRTQPRLLGCGKGPSPHARTRTHTGTRTHARCRDGVAADRPHRRRCRRLRRR